MELKCETTRLIKRCTCSSLFQDERYGQGNRLHRRVTRNKGSMMERVEDRCTVCFIKPFRLGGHGSTEIRMSFRHANWPIGKLPIGPIKIRGKLIGGLNESM